LTRPHGAGEFALTESRYLARLTNSLADLSSESGCGMGPLGPLARGLVQLRLPVFARVIWLALGGAQGPRQCRARSGTSDAA